MTTTKRERYLKLKHDLLERCGQCMGFRARGIDISREKPDVPCVPSVDCHKSCPALGMGKVSKDRPVQDLENNLYQLMTADTPAEENDKNYIPQSCFGCGRSEDQGTLLPCRNKGKSRWVCTKCLPSLIHS